MLAADVVLLASGTATLEAMLAKRPMVVGYRVAPLSYRIARALNMIKTDVYSLPNILARASGLGPGPWVPELMQDDCTVDKLAAATLALFSDSERRSAIVAAFEYLHQELRGDMAGHAGARAATAVAELVDHHGRADGCACSRQPSPSAALAGGRGRIGHRPAGRRCRRSRSRPSRRSAGGGGGDPRSGPADPRPRRFEEAQRGAPRGAVPADSRTRAGVLHRAGRAGGNRFAEHLPRHHDRHAPRPRRPGARRAARADRRQQAAAGPALPGARDRRRRRAGTGHQRGLDPGQGHPRPLDGGTGRAPPRLRLRPAQGLPHAGPPLLAAAAGAMPTAPPQLCPGAPAAGSGQLVLRQTSRPRLPHPAIAYTGLS